MTTQVGGGVRRKPTPEAAIVSFLEVEAAAGRWPSARALHERFGGSYGRLLRIRSDFAIAQPDALPPEERRRAKRSGQPSAGALAALGDHLKQTLLAAPVRLDPRQFDQMVRGLEDRVVRRVSDALADRRRSIPQTPATAPPVDSDAWRMALDQAGAAATRLEAAASRIEQLGQREARSTVNDPATGPDAGGLDATEILEAALNRHRDAVKSLQGEFLAQLGKVVSAEINALATAREDIKQTLETLASRIPTPEDLAGVGHALQRLERAEKARSKSSTSTIPRLVQDLVTQALDIWATPLSTEMRELRKQLAAAAARPRKNSVAPRAKATSKKGGGTKRKSTAATKKARVTTRSRKGAATEKKRRSVTASKPIQSVLTPAKKAKGARRAAARRKTSSHAKAKPSKTPASKGKPIAAGKRMRRPARSGTGAALSKKRRSTPQGKAAKRKAPTGSRRARKSG